MLTVMMESKTPMAEIEEPVTLSLMNFEITIMLFQLQVFGEEVSRVKISV